MIKSKPRLAPEESRAVALAAAREILIENGPQAVTLKAVADRVGRTHANLLHHFGTASAFQIALASSLANDLARQIGAVVQHAREGTAERRDIVDMVFDAFSKHGAGALASWMILTGDREALDPILNAIHDVVEELNEDGMANVADITLMLMLAALGDSLLGLPFAKVLGLPTGRARELALSQLNAIAGPPPAAA